LARIIYVEDDDLMGSVVKDILTAAGHAVDVVSHGTLGLQTIASDRPDLVILDIALPGMSGIDVARNLRQLPATRLVPILMLTASRSESVSREALDAGADDVMIKLVSYTGLVSKVERMLGAAD
jgi:DNA-binding response OmpR family regulator